MEKTKKKPMRYRRLFKAVSIILLITTFVFLLNLFRMDLLGVKYMAILCIGIFVIEWFLLFVLNKRFKVVIKLPFLCIAVFLSGVFIFGTYNLGLAASFVERIVSPTLQEEKYEIYVLNDSKYSSVRDLDKAVLGIFDNKSDTLEDALKLLKKETTFKKEITYDDIEEMLKDGIDEKIDAIYITTSILENVREQYSDLFYNFKAIGDITVSTKQTVKKRDIDVTKEPFVVYISGIDTYGSIGTVSRSDVNILVAVNPKTEKVLLINTPRDYYVKLHTKKAFDKLTHAGIYGVEESMDTLADLYATDVDFYLKVNFSSLIKIVDALGGITVDSKFNFSYDGFDFKKGENKLNGAGALAFSRYRKTLPEGDISRGENQEAVIEAIFKKISNPSVISKYSKVLDTLGKSFVTNMDEEDIYSLAKFQLNKSPKWSIDSQNAYGSNGYETTYSMGKTKLYVMIPDEKSVSEVKQRLNDLLSEKP